MNETRIEFGINEQLEDIRLQLMIVNKMEGLEVSLNRKEVWLQLKKEGRVSRIPNSDENEEHSIVNQRMIGYIAIIDSVAGIIYGDNIGNKNRFVKLLENFVCWEDIDRISMPHLYQLFRIFPFPEFEDAKDKVFAYIDDKTSKDQEYKISDDIKIEVVLGWFKDKAKNKNINAKDILKPTGLSLQDLTHGSLFYRLRNKLVHSGDTYGILPAVASKKMSPSPNYPLYFLTKYEVGPEDSGQAYLSDVTFGLYYPPKFIAEIANKAVDGLQNYLMKWRVKSPIKNKRDCYYYEVLNHDDDW